MTLHLYPQEDEHDDAFIVGTRIGLIKLRDSINAALSNKYEGKSSDSLSEHFTSDGEGYDLTVKVIPFSIEANISLPYAISINRSLGRDSIVPSIVPTDDLSEE